MLAVGQKCQVPITTPFNCVSAIFGISDHDLMFTQEVPQEEEEEEEEGDFQNGFGSAYDYSVYRDKVRKLHCKRTITREII